MDIDTSLKAGALPEENSSASDNSIDPLIAARVIVPFNDRRFETAFADVGGFLSGFQLDLASLRQRRLSLQ